MFDRVIEKPRSRPWATVVIIASATAHGLALAALMVAGLWKIERLPIALTSEITFAPRPPPGDAAPAPAKKLAVAKAARVVKPAKAVVSQPVQPTVVAVVTPPITATGAEMGQGTDGAGGDGDGTGSGGCATPPCTTGGTGDEPGEPDEVAPPALKPEIVSPIVARGLRIAGNEQIYPPDSVKVDMLHQGKDTIQGSFQICVGTGGLIDSVRIRRTTGYDAYDAELVREMRQWRYRPYLVGGVAAPMCAVEVVVYRMRK